MRRATLYTSLIALGMLCACAAGSDSVNGNISLGEPLASLSAEADVPARFSWIVDKELSGLAHPATGQGLAWNLQYLVDQGVTVLYTLTMTPLDESIVASYPITNIHLPVKDFAPPTLEQLESFITTTAEAVEQGGAGAAHCAAGLGRTGTFAAAYLVYKGMTPTQAIAKVRDLRPGSIETSAQEDAVHAYAQSIGRVRQ